MKVYQINYDLRKERNYDALYQKIKSYGTWSHPLKSCWILVSEQTAEQIRNNLFSVMDNDDGILVTRLYPEAAWENLDSDRDNSMTDWLKEYIGAAS